MAAPRTRPLFEHLNAASNEPCAIPTA